jgi:hypothetical protein
MLYAGLVDPGLLDHKRHIDRTVVALLRNRYYEDL